MSRTKRNKSVRMQNRLQFERRFYTGKLFELHGAGVSMRQAVRVKCDLELPAIELSDGLSTVKDMAHGAYNATQKSYRLARKGKYEYRHNSNLRTPSDHLHELKKARQAYTKQFAAMQVHGMNAVIFDRFFKGKFPEYWKLYHDNKLEFRTGKHK